MDGAGARARAGLSRRLRLVQLSLEVGELVPGSPVVAGPWPRDCDWCGGEIDVQARRDSVTCSKRCRQARHRFMRGLVVRERSKLPLRLAYADPPYPGKAWLYRDHPDYAGEVDHLELVSRLQGYDGWALSTSSAALPAVLAYCGELELEVRVAAWVRGERSNKSRWPLSAWEPVVYSGGRRMVSRSPGVDALVYGSRPRLTDPGRVIGMKPAAFAWWLFDLLGALPGDELDDLFPGSGGIGRAWRLYEHASRSAAADASRGAGAPRRVASRSRRRPVGGEPCEFCGDGPCEHGCFEQEAVS